MYIEINTDVTVVHILYHEEFNINLRASTSIIKSDTKDRNNSIIMVVQIK